MCSTIAAVNESWDCGNVDTYDDDWITCWLLPRDGWLTTIPVVCRSCHALWHVATRLSSTFSNNWHPCTHLEGMYLLLCVSALDLCTYALAMHSLTVVSRPRVSETEPKWFMIETLCNSINGWTWQYKFLKKHAGTPFNWMVNNIRHVQPPRGDNRHCLSTAV